MARLSCRFVVARWIITCSRINERVVIRRAHSFVHHLIYWTTCNHLLLTSVVRLTRTTLFARLNARKHIYLSKCFDFFLLMGFHVTSIVRVARLTMTSSSGESESAWEERQHIDYIHARACALHGLDSTRRTRDSSLANNHHWEKKNRTVTSKQGIRFPF